MRRRIFRSNKGPIPVNISTPNNAFIHVKTHHDKELSRLWKHANEATIELPLTDHRNNNQNRSRNMTTAAAGVLLNNNVQPQVQERRTRREVRLGIFNPNQSTALVPVPARHQQHELTRFDGDNNIRFKIQVTDQKGAERPTKILAALSKKAAIQRQDGVVKLTRSGFHTPCIREIGSNEDICQLENVQGNEQAKPSKNDYDLWNKALVEYSEQFQHDGNHPQNHAQSPFHNRNPMQQPHNKKGFPKQLEKENKQKIHENRRKPYPVNQYPSPLDSCSSSDQGSNESITRSNETGSNLYGSREYRRGLQGRERYQQGASILKTSTPNPELRRAHENGNPIYLQDKREYAELQPQFQCLPSVNQTVQPCATCQYTPCSACGTLICVGCMAEPCVSCSAPLCSACNIESYAANNETLCMSCTLKPQSPLLRQLAYNRSSSSGELGIDPNSYEDSRPMRSGPKDRPPKRKNIDSREKMARPESPRLTRGELVQNMPHDPYTPQNFRQQYPPVPDDSDYPIRGALPPGFPTSLSPASPFIDYATRRNLPPLIPNYVCEPLPPMKQFPPCEPCFDDMACPSASIIPRKNKFLELIAGQRPELSVQHCPSTLSCSCCCCYGPEDAVGDCTSVVCPPSWLQCTQPCPTRHCYYEEEHCLTTLVHVSVIILPLIAFYVLAYYGTTRLIGTNKFSRLAAVMANLTLLYILSLEPDDLVMYATDKPKITPGISRLCAPSQRRDSMKSCPSPKLCTPGLDFSNAESNRSAP